jgi:hypothetical protein
MLMTAKLAGRQVAIRAKDQTLFGVTKCAMDWVQLP